MASIKKPIRALTVAEIDDAVKRSSLDLAKYGPRVAPAERSEAALRAVTPPSNTGGKSNAWRWGEPEEHEKIVLENGKPKVTPARRGYGGDVAFVDWLNITVKEETFWGAKGQGTPITDSQVIADVSVICQRLFGFGVTANRGQGANFYRDSYMLGDDFGMVCHGGQNGTVLITLSGRGALAAAKDWELRTYQFLTEKAIQPRITRCDLASDDFNGAVPVHAYSLLYDEGGFNCGGRNPSCEFRGDWKNDDGKGRTFYVGNRRNGKYFRAYEKGRQLGDPNSKWVRVEVEFKSIDRDIPFEILLKAGEYLAAAYPCLMPLSEVHSRIKTHKKTLQITYDSACKWLKTQVGAWLWVGAMTESEGDQITPDGVMALLSKIMREGVTPKRLQIPVPYEAGFVPA